MTCVPLQFSVTCSIASTRCEKSNSSASLTIRMYAFANLLLIAVLCPFSQVRGSGVRVPPPREFGLEGTQNGPNFLGFATHTILHFHFQAIFFHVIGGILVRSVSTNNNLINHFRGLWSEVKWKFHLLLEHVIQGRQAMKFLCGVAIFHKIFYLYLYCL